MGCAFNAPTHYRVDLFGVSIDNFKNYLDKHGLSEGDKILIEIANKLKQTYPNQNIYRFGGDEFVVILGDEEVQLPKIKDEVQLKYSVVTASVSKNQRRNHHINRELVFYLDKGIVESTFEGKNISYRNEIEK